VLHTWGAVQSASPLQPESHVFVDGLQYLPVSHVSLLGKHPTHVSVFASQTGLEGSSAQSFGQFGAFPPLPPLPLEVDAPVELVPLSLHAAR
jgi:hypothetical protein